VIKGDPSTKELFIASIVPRKVKTRATRIDTTILEKDWKQPSLSQETVSVDILDAHISPQRSSTCTTSVVSNSVSQKCNIMFFVMLD